MDKGGEGLGIGNNRGDEDGVVSCMETCKTKLALNILQCNKQQLNSHRTCTICMHWNVPPHTHVHAHTHTPGIGSFPGASSSSTSWSMHSRM